MKGCRFSHPRPPPPSSFSLFGKTRRRRVVRVRDGRRLLHCPWLATRGVPSWPRPSGPPPTHRLGSCAAGDIHSLVFFVFCFSCLASFRFLFFFFSLFGFTRLATTGNHSSLISEKRFTNIKLHCKDSAALRATGAIFPAGVGDYRLVAFPRDSQDGCFSCCTFFFFFFKRRQTSQVHLF